MAHFVSAEGCAMCQRGVILGFASLAQVGFYGLWY